MSGRIFVTGDCHSDFRKFNTGYFPVQSEFDKDDYVIICGDFGGIWNVGWENKNEKYWLDWLEKTTGNMMRLQRILRQLISRLIILLHTAVQVKPRIC